MEVGIGLAKLRLAKISVLGVLVPEDLFETKYSTMLTKRMPSWLQLQGPAIPIFNLSRLLDFRARDLHHGNFLEAEGCFENINQSGKWGERIISITVHPRCSLDKCTHLRMVGGSVQLPPNRVSKRVPLPHFNLHKEVSAQSLAHKSSFSIE